MRLVALSRAWISHDTNALATATHPARLAAPQRASIPPVGLRAPPGECSTQSATAQTRAAADGRASDNAWSTYSAAIDSGWGATCRLCVILMARWGLPVSGVVQLTSLILRHLH
jgi:hypothetical protein